MSFIVQLPKDVDTLTQYRIIMSVFEFFHRYKCTKDEKEHLLNHLCAIRIKRIIKEMDILHERTT